MFAVEGWKLGQLVTQTSPKNKRKRKREEMEERKLTDNSKPLNKPRKNPFLLRKQQGSHTTAVSGLEAKPSKKPSAGVAGLDKPGGKDTKSPRQLQGSQDQPRQKATKKAKKQRRQGQQAGPEVQPVDEVKSLGQSFQQVAPPEKLTPLQQKMQARLTGSQFRHINEKLYTTDSSVALTLFAEQPSLFNDVYTCICRADIG